MGNIARWECPNDSGHDVQAAAAPVGVERWRCFACGVEAVKVEYVRAEQLRGAVSFTDDELQCLTCAMAGNFPERFGPIRAGLLRKLFKAYPYAGGQ